MGRWSGGTYDNGDGTWSTVVSDENGNTSSSGSAVTQYADNTAHSSGDTGMYILVVRQDVAASLVSADGRYTGVTVDANNQVRVTGGALSAANDAVAVGTRTTGGASMHKTVSAATTNATSVKGAAGTLYGIQVGNINAAARYLKLYNKASAPTVGSDTPVKTLTIPGNTAGAGSNVPLPDCGDAFTVGIAFALTTGIADSDTGAVAANEITVNLDYA